MTALLKHIRIGEILMVVTGFLMLASVVFISANGDFTLWNISKLTFGIGLLFILFDT